MALYRLGIIMTIDFSFETPYGKFSDALWFPEGMEIPNDAELEAMKHERLNNWVATVAGAQE
jgi:hypothetical protein